MNVELRYRAERGAQGQTIQRPVAKVILTGPNGRNVVEYLYIDSGADFTIIPYRLGLYLGLQVDGEEVQTVQGISGGIGVIYATAQVTIGELTIPARIAWAQLETVPLLLGRADVFDAFEITFKQREGRILFNEVGKGKQNMRFGCCAGPEMGDVLAQAGYDYIELSVSRHLQPEVGDEDWAPLCQAIEAQPLPAEAFNTFLPTDLKITGPTVDEERIGRYLKVAFERAAKLGGQVIVFGSGGARTIPQGFPRERAWQQLLDFVRKAGEEAAQAGMIVCIEPLNRSESNVLNDLGEAVRLAQEADHPQVRALADLYHMVREEESMENLAAAGDWIFHVHVADTDRQPPGLGSYPYPAFFSTLQQLGYEGRCSIECRWEDLAAECGPALEFLRRMWDRATP